VELADALGREHPPYAGVPHIVSLAATYLIHFPEMVFRCIVSSGHSGKMPFTEDCRELLAVDNQTPDSNRHA